jgi:hypothetical protein
VSSAAAIPTVPFSDAKENLSGFISKVVHEHAPQILARSRGRESVLVLPLADMLPALSGCRFDARVTFGRRSVVATLPQFGLVASGASFDGALERLAEELAEYAEDYFSDFDFYRHTHRIAHLPWVLRFVLTPAAERSSLLVEEPAPTPEVAVMRAR